MIILTGLKKIMYGCWKTIQSEEPKEKANHFTSPIFNPMSREASWVKSFCIFSSFFLLINTDEGFRISKVIGLFGFKFVRQMALH